MASFQVKETKTVNATVLCVEAGVRYWEDASVNGVEDENGNLIPFRMGDSWCPAINIDNGVVVGWPKGTEARIHYKVCDAGVYTLLDPDGKILKRREGYVPGMLSPGGSGYGDYIIMTIDADGEIANWTADLSDFEDDD